MKTFEIVQEGIQKFRMAATGIKCLVCGRTSWNENDVKNRYCGNCHQYHDIMERDDGHLQDSTS